MPVLPPTELSTWASRLVGICTKGMPRRTLAATKPARSPTTPPPRATIASPRSSRASSTRSQTVSNTSKRLLASPGGSRIETKPMAARLQRILQGGQVMPGDRFVGDDGDAGTGQRLRDARAGTRQQVAADQDVVGPGAEIDGDPLRGDVVCVRVCSLCHRVPCGHGVSASADATAGSAARPRCRSSASTMSTTTASCGTSRDQIATSARA